MGFTDHMGRLYHEWGIRVVVLLSLLFQVLLQLFGNRRKSSHSGLLRSIVWLSYVSADSIATLALGMISTKLACIKDLSSLNGQTKLNILWAPCLLVLLGGPDSITAYSVEDNELWLRHGFALVTQTSLTGYICFLAWASDCPSYLSLGILVVGVVKYGERVWVLWQASFDKLPDGSYVTRKDWTIIRRDGEVIRGYLLFQIFKKIFVNQRLSFRDISVGDETFGIPANYKPYMPPHLSFKVSTDNFTHQVAFEIIEIELGFMHDLLYTRMVTTCTVWGLCRRFITFTISCSVLAVFSWFVNNTSYNPTDVVVTFVLLGANILSEIYWVTTLLSSDWLEIKWPRKFRCFAELWFHDKNVVRNALLLCFKQPRWSRSAGQLSFFVLLFRYKVMCLNCGCLFEPEQLLEKLGLSYHTQHQKVTDYIKKEVFMILDVQLAKQKSLEKELAKKKILEKVDKKDDQTKTSGDKDIQWLFTRHIELLKYLRAGEPPVTLDHELKKEYDFEDHIMIWHIATELFYFSGASSPASNERNAAMLLSRYMFYILARYPSMLQTRNRNERLLKIKLLLQRFNEVSSGRMNVKQTLTEFLDNETNRELGDHSDYACRLARDLIIYGENTSNSVWRFLLNSWLAHLLYAAYNCREEHHTQQLRRGGEFLTHVWMLLVHFGFTKHSQRLVDEF